ncbi:MAG: hypothetical protein LBQ32_05210 [Burkholderiaceae bacterium]|jgi:hypothetical protein|nr:hypothetical protein [Burkholderiaceae bacterium]
MKKNLILFAIGFFVPIFWGAMGFVFFSAPESLWVDLFWDAVYFTCPFWALPGDFGMICMPFLNATLYVCIGLLIRQVRVNWGKGHKPV